MTASIATELVLDKLWEQAEPLLFITKDEFLRGLDGWVIEPVEIDGVLAFVTITKGPQFHFQSLGTGHRLSLKMIRAFLQKIIDQHGYATTKTPLGDERQHRFNVRFGFVATHDDEFDRHYRIERIPGCPSYQ